MLVIDELHGKALLVALSQEFTHLKKVAQAGVDRGDPSIAALLFQSYTDEARRCHKIELLKSKAESKARQMAGVLAQHEPNDLSRLPNPSNDSPQAWGLVKPRRKDPVLFMRLSGHEQWAVSEIRQIYQATIRAVMPRPKPLDAIRVDTSPQIHDPLTPLERFTGERLNRYYTWTKRQRDSGFDLVIYVVIDGYGLRDIARIGDEHPEAVRRRFRSALRDY